MRFDVGEECRLALPPQSLLDEGAERDLEAHGQLELHHRLSREDAGLGEDVLGENQEHSGAILQDTLLPRPIGYASGRPTTTSRPIADSTRMASHEGSNSAPRTLNFAERG